MASRENETSGGEPIALKLRVQTPMNATTGVGFNPRQRKPPATGQKGPEEAVVVLPGYAAGIDEPGILHSRSKLRSSADRLSAKLREIYRRSSAPAAGPNAPPPWDAIGGGVGVSGGVGGIRTFHCLDEAETWSYRCRCNFQIVRVPPDDGVYRYAMRSGGEPVLLGTRNSFPIAARRIQAAMKELMDHLNMNDGGPGTGEDGAAGYREGEEEDDAISFDGHLTSCTFSSAWRDSPDSDCVLTLHYDRPLDGDESSETSWMRQARLLCRRMRLRQLNGRSKGTVLSVKGGEDLDSAEKDREASDDDDDGGATEATIRDTIFLLRSDGEDDDDEEAEEDCSATKPEWRVSLESEDPPDGSNSTVAIPVHYDKPESAFYHPNRNAMTTALSWMLNRLASISISSSSSSSSSSEGSPQRRKLSVLEMYCGCGAHTVALGRSGLVSGILAVELDPRLVRACEGNVARNDLQTAVEVRRGDAGRWAREESRKRRGRRRRRRELAEEGTAVVAPPEDGDGPYDVLLVDPPRQGLDDDVCRMAMMTVDGETGDADGEGCFRNVLYVSCGHLALLRDLERLAPAYEVVSCAQMDLFPRTDSIETLVHLRRRTQL